MSTHSFVHVLSIEVEKGTVVVVLCAEAAFANAHTNDDADLAARRPGVHQIRRGVAGRETQRAPDRFATERPLDINRTAAAAIPLGAVRTMRAVAAINTKHRIFASLAREARKSPPNENSHFVSGYFPT